MRGSLLSRLTQGRSFSTRLSLYLVGFTSLLFIIAFAVISLYSHKIISDEAMNSATGTVNTTIKELEKTIESVEASVKGMSWLVGEHVGDETYLYHITRRMVEENDQIVAAGIAFVEDYFPGKQYFCPYTYTEPGSGRLVSKQLGGSRYDYFHMDWFQIPYLLGTESWSEPYYDEGGGMVYMSTFAFPLRGEDGEVYAILEADMSLDWISQYIESMRPYENSQVYLVTRCGQFVGLGQDSARIGETLFSYTYEEPDERIHQFATAMTKGESGVQRFSLEGKPSFAAYGPLSNGWSAAVICRYGDVLGRNTKMQVILLLVCLLALAALFVYCHVMIRRMTRPLHDFSKSALSIAGGNFDTALPNITQGDEIGQLRDSFDSMQRSLKDYMSSLKESMAANERYESELNIANAIQMAMLPKDFPNFDHVQLYARLIPAREVGGDLYDFFRKDDYMYFAIGDVSGKGVPASLVMAICRSAFRLIANMDVPLDTVVSEMNDTIAEGNETYMFITFFAGKLNMLTGELTYCNAGHNAPVIISPDGGAAFLDVVPNIALGLFPGFSFSTQTVTLQPGSRLVLYTDGVTEAERGDKEQYGETRLLDWSTSSTRVIVGTSNALDSLLSEIHTFVEGNAQNDDITIMTIKYK